MPSKKLLKPLFASLLMGATLFSSNSDATSASRTEVKKIVIEEASISNVPAALAMAVAKVESDFQYRVRSHKGAIGVMQIMPATARSEFGINPDELWDPRLNIQLGIDFLEQLYAQYGEKWELALSHYNGGTLKGGKGAFAKPHGYTKKYVADVFRWWKRYQDQADVWGTTALANVEVKDTWVPARTKVTSNTASNEIEISGEADPKRTIDTEIEYVKVIKNKNAIFTADNQVEIMPKIATAIIARDMQPLKIANKNLKGSANNEVTYFTTEPLNRTSKTGDENLNNFWDRVSHAKKNLDDFGSIRNGGNG